MRWSLQLVLSVSIILAIGSFAFLTTSSQSKVQRSVVLSVSPSETIWTIRRKMTRTALRPMLQKSKGKLSSAGAEGKKVDGNTGKWGLLITTFLLVIGSATLRIGGRGALLNLVGLDFLNGDDGSMNSLREQVDAFLRSFGNLGMLAYPSFVVAWIVAKCFCIDILAIGLAISSGVLFGGFLEGTIASVTASTIASLVGFFVSRTFLFDLASEQIAKRPLLRAVERNVAKEGFKTVLALRLSPILPIPIGAYNYVYGATSVKTLDFVSGIFLGSIKPMALDSYLGLFGKSIIDRDSSTDDTLLLIVIFAVIITGTLATQVVSSTIEEINSEASALSVATPISRKMSINDDESDMVDITDGLHESMPFTSTFRLLGIKDSDVPVWLQPIRRGFEDAIYRLNLVMEDELRAVEEEIRLGIDVDKEANIDWGGNIGEHTNESTYPGMRQIKEFESRPASGLFDASYVNESFAFTFTLLAFLTKVSKIKQP